MADPSQTIQQILGSVMGPGANYLPGAENYFTPRILKKGDLWLRPGQICHHIAFIRSGMLRAYVSTDSGDHTRWAFLENQFFTSVSSFGLQRPSEESIEALEDTELFQLTFTDWGKLCENYPQLQKYWSATLLDLCGCYESRLHSLLINDAEGRYRYLLERYPEFILHVPQKYVAEMLGIAPRHLSRIRAGLQKGH